MKISAAAVAFVAALSPVHATDQCLYQADFDQGTKIISSSGKYQLCEDIVFDPIAPSYPPPEDAYDPSFGGIYDEEAFGLGFFSAIAVTTSNVEIDLNGHTIEQSKGHALFQRFFAIIELASAPFIKNAGPAQFVGDDDTFEPASHVVITGPGTIGRSSHHGIHGNDNHNITIKDVEFRDFEVAAVSLNKVDTLVIQRNRMTNRHDVPVNGMFSAARFIRPYGKALAEKDFKMKLRGQMESAKQVYDDLITSINNVYNDVVRMDKVSIDQVEHPTEYSLYHNRFSVIDGPCYAMVVHGKGPAVGGQGGFLDVDDEMTSSNVTISDNIITDITCATNEIPATVVDGVVQNDARGGILQLVSSFDNSGIAIDANGKYIGNVVSDMQIMVAHAINEGFLDDTGLQLQTNTISQEIIDWAEGTDSYVPKYRCNGDSMHHVNKGIIIIRVEDTKGFAISNNTIDRVKNFSPPPFADCNDYHQGASFENLDEQQGANIRSVSVAAVRGFTQSSSVIEKNAILNSASPNANVIIGIDVQGDSKDVVVSKNLVDLDANVGEDPNDKFIAIRVREYVDTQGEDHIKVQGNNVFAQEIETVKRRVLRSSSNKLPHGHPDFMKDTHEIEWKLGGCPFAYGK